MVKRGDPDWEEYRGCQRKRRFASEPTSADYIPGYMRPYRCKFCEGWHLTSKPRTGSQKREEEARDAMRITPPAIPG
jgi:hypothetical protein